jgi:uncharacterized protein (DUF697 family)
MDDLTRKSDKIIKDFAFGSVIAGFIPIPFLDMMGLISTQRMMVYRLSKLYGVPYSENLAKTYLTTLMGGLTAFAALPTLSGIFKMFPGVGTLAGGAGMAAVSSASTYAVGKVFQQHFERGGTLNSFDPTTAKHLLEEEFEKGRALSK